MADKRPQLSVGMIVKNEERCLERCLKALQPLRKYIDMEVVIADTGSTDRTKEIAAKYADILFDFEWVQDFSKARNAVMDRCSGTWYLSLDADEYLDEGSVKEFTTFIKGKESKKVDAAIIAIYNYDDVDDDTQYSEFYTARLVKMSTGVRFKGRIHEAFEENKVKSALQLPRIIFWHDGYLRTDDYAKKDKKDRNMSLLEKEIEEDPDNVLRYLQAIESSRTRDEQIKYTKMAIKLFKDAEERKDKQRPTVKNLKVIKAAIYRYAVYFAWTYKLPEYEEWLEYIKNNFRDSIFTQIDVRYLQITIANQRSNYQFVIDEGKKYLDLLSKPYTHKMQEELRLSTLNWEGKGNKQSAALWVAKAYAMKNQPEESKKLLTEYKPENLISTCFQVWLDVAYQIWDKVDLKSLFSDLYAYLFGKSESELDKNTISKKEIFIAATKKQFTYKHPESDIEGLMPEKPAYELIATMGDCDLSYAAKIMYSDDENEIQQYLNKIEVWTTVPNPVWRKLVEKNGQLPKAFYELKADTIQSIAGALTVYLNDNGLLLKWVNQLPDVDEPLDTPWKYHLFTAMVRTEKWKSDEEPEYRAELLEKYLLKTKEFLLWYYNAALLCERMVKVLPDMHAFAWFMTQYDEEMKKNDLKKAVYWLKKALRTAKVMKHMVQYLVEKVENQIKVPKMEEVAPEVAPELKMLAQKVKAILGAYPANDPAVMAIKQSDMYKRVAHLIESE